MTETVAQSAEDQAILARADVGALLDSVSDAIRVADGGVTVVDEETLRTSAIDKLVRVGVFAEDEDLRDAARWLIGEVGAAVGIVPASIHELYIARGQAKTGGFTVPAMNVRAAAFDTGRALFAAARELNVGALICEIARSEIGYTDQRPAEYVCAMTAAAIKERWRGPLFIQGDHFQVNAKKYAADPEPELRAVRDLIREAIHAGFYNIDVDTSTLVDLSRSSLADQQETNSRLSAGLTAFIRRRQPEGITMSVGGEIGEVGTENSTPDELRAYMEGFERVLAETSAERGADLAGLSKISVQSGTSHGGVVLPDGSIADVAIDFETLRVLSRLARDEYGLAGAVQHGASTLPSSAFGTFPDVETAEIHLATNFQNILYEHAALPVQLRDRMYEHCRSSFASERKPKDTEEQFIYKTRKKALGAFKRDLWDLPEESRARIRDGLQEQFAFLFRQLRVENTRDIVDRFVTVPSGGRVGPTSMRIEVAADDWDLSD